MIKNVFVLFLILIFSNCSAQELRSFKNHEYKGKSYTYAIQLPDNFDKNKIYPVLIGPADMQKKNQSFYHKNIKSTEGWIIVDYPIYNAQSRIFQVKSLLDHLRSEYKVENNKFHTVCFSANSAGIFDLVMELSDDFAGITGMAGNPNTSNLKKLNKLKNVKVQFVVGDKDSYWMSSAKRSHKILLEIGVDSRIEIIKNGPHVMTELVGKPFLERAHRLRN